MIYRTTLKEAEHYLGFQKKDKSYTFLHWLHHSSDTSRFKWYKFSRTLKEYSVVGPTILVEWEDD